MNRVYIVMHRRQTRDVPIKSFETRDMANHHASDLTKEQLREEHMREAVGLLVEQYKQDNNIEQSAPLSKVVLDDFTKNLCGTLMIDYESYVARKNDIFTGDYTVVDTSFESL